MNRGRRARMTRLLIRDALIRILSDNPGRHVSVTALCDEADVARSTFYVHYRSTEEVLDEIEEEFIRHVSFVDESKTVSQNVKALEGYFSYCQEHQRLYHALRGAGRITSRVESESMSLFDASPQGRVATRAERDRHLLVVRYTLYGTLSMLDAWAAGTTVLDAHEAARTIFELSLAAAQV